MIHLPTLMKAYKGIFSGSSMPHGFKARTFKAGLKGADCPGGLRIIEQNPAKPSLTAKMARAGNKVAWIMKGPRYLGKIINGTPDPHIIKNGGI